MKTKTLIGSLLIAGALLLPSAALAQYQPEQPPSTKILIDKTVFNPGKNVFVDNLTVNQHNFLPDQEIKFRLAVKNTGNQELKDIEVTDKLPNYVKFVSGPGNYNKDNHTLIFKIDTLKVDEEKTFEIKVKVKEAKEIPSNVLCITNIGEVRASNLFSQDTSSICIQKNVLGQTTVLPKTGFGGFDMMLVTSVASSAAAIYFARKSIKKA